MILIGEKFNSSIPAAREAYASRDTAYFSDLARRQIEGGADYLDLNAAMLPDEPEALRWAVGTLRGCGAGLVIDSADPKAMAFALGEEPPEKLLLNSVTLEEERLSGVLPLAQKLGAGVVALPIDERGMPKDAARRAENAEKLIARLAKEGFPEDRVFIDIIAEAASASWEGPRQALEAAARIRAAHPEVHLIAGASNVSFGLPKRAAVNAAFITSAVAMGVDSFILDTASADLALRLRAAMLVNGLDEYGMGYIETYRALFEKE